MSIDQVYTEIIMEHNKSGHNKKEMEALAKHSKEESLLIIANLRSMNTTVSNTLADEMEKQLH